MVSENFSIKEMQCKCSKCGHTCAMDSYFMERLEILRLKTGPLDVNSGFRCNDHNKEINGASGSWHTKGKAADCVPRNINLKELENMANMLFEEVIRYDDFVHIAHPL